MPARLPQGDLSPIGLATPKLALGVLTVITSTQSTAFLGATLKAEGFIGA
jgi:hypothetical protein